MLLTRAKVNPRVIRYRRGTRCRLSRPSNAGLWPSSPPTWSAIAASWAKTRQARLAHSRRIASRSLSRKLRSTVAALSSSWATVP
jgi:hypothetical protein